MASTYLSRTPSSSSNRRTWTFSAWVKRSNLSTGNQVLFQGIDGGFPEKIQFTSSDRIEYDHDIAGTDYTIYSERRFRDTNGWYHIVVAKDTTQATETDRIKIYVNNEQVAMTEEALGYPGQNYEGAINKNVVHNIGANNSGSSEVFSGCMSHVHFVDGTALTPSTFGETDSTTGEWKIKTSPSYTVGTNGFFILKDGNSLTDQSANSNNFSLSNGTLTKTEDNPSNVFATMNFASTQGNYTLTKGNLVCYGGNQNDWKYAFISNIGASSGKYYWEIRLNTDTDYNITGVIRSDKTWTNSTIYSNGGFNGVQSSTNAGGLGIYSQTGASMGGALYIGGTSVSLTTNDIIMYALDLDNKKMWIGKNGVWADDGNSGNTGNPSTGAYPLWGTGEFTTGAHYLPASIIYYTNAHVYNFGNGYFETSQVSSAGTNASGNGIFEYDVPTGYTALSTKGLNL